MLHYCTQATPLFRKVDDYNRPPLSTQNANAGQSPIPGKLIVRPVNAMNRAVFIDRDGTLNVHAGYIVHPDQLHVYDFTGPAVRRLNDAGWLCVLVTNQGIIARGECSFEQLTAIHRKLADTLAAHGAHLDGIYVCPHHPLAGPLCDCRKPSPGLLRQAAHELDIDLGRSWTVGDSTSDIAAGFAAGTSTALVETGLAGSDGRCAVHPDLQVPDFLSFVNAVCPTRARS